MKQFSIKYSCLCLLTGALILTAMNFLVAKTHLVKSEVILKRFNSSISGDNSELAKNRWIWVRDGLEIAKRLQAVPLASKILSELNYQQVDATQWASNNLKVDYTGGDENLYILEVRSWDRESGQLISQALINELEKMGQEKIPANEQSNIGTTMTEVITPPTYLGNTFSLKLKSMLFVVILSSLIAGLIPLMVANLKKQI